MTFPVASSEVAAGQLQSATPASDTKSDTSQQNEPLGIAQSAAQGQPQYVAYGSEQVYCQPFDCQHVRLYGFIFQVDKDNANALLNTCLNAPTEGKTDYQMVAPYALVTFAHMGPLAARNPPYSNQGFFEYDEATIWLLTMALEEHHGHKTVDRLAWFIPYIFPELSQALCCGREIYGYPKEYSWPQLPANPHDLDCFTLETVLLESFKSPEPARRGQLLQIKRIESHANGPLHPVQSIETAMSEILGLLGLAEAFTATGLEVDLRLLDYALHHKAQMVFLKQFRDAADGKRACYQAIVEAPSIVHKVYNVGLLMDSYEMNIVQADSHPICREVGLAATSKAVAGFYVDFDMGIEPGQEIWKA